MRGGVTPTELSRAKNQLKSSLVMALESRSVEVEGEPPLSDARTRSRSLIRFAFGSIDLGRQTQIHGKKVPVHEMCAKIDAVTLEVSRCSHITLRPNNLIVLCHVAGHPPNCISRTATS